MFWSLFVKRFFYFVYTFLKAEICELIFYLWFIVMWKSWSNPKFSKLILKHIKTSFFDKNLHFRTKKSQIHPHFLEISAKSQLPFGKKVKKVDILAGGGIIEVGIINNNINPPCEGFWLPPKAGGLTSPPKDFFQKSSSQGGRETFI